MKILIDTNVILRFSDPGHKEFELAGHALDVLDQREHELRIVAQVLYEYWVVATRPVERNGLGFSTTQTYRSMDG